MIRRLQGLIVIVLGPQVRLGIGIDPVYEGIHEVIELVFGNVDTEHGEEPLELTDAKLAVVIVLRQGVQVDLSALIGDAAGQLRVSSR